MFSKLSSVAVVQVLKIRAIITTAYFRKFTHYITKHKHGGMIPAANGVDVDGLEGDKKNSKVYKVVLTGGLFN